MKKQFLLILMLLTWVSTNAQNYFMSGLIPDDGTYETLPLKKEVLMKGTPPSKCSMLQYCPNVGDQGDYGTCTGWASVYAARTIAEAIKYGWTDKNKITEEAFSPLFVYALIKETSDVNCKDGSKIYDALDLLKKMGVPKLKDFTPKCASANDINRDLKKIAAKNKIDDWCVLFNNDTQKNKNSKIQSVKKSIMERKPVVIAMWLHRSTFSYTEKVLDLSKVDSDFPKKNKNFEGYHAMCVVGYDDNMYGGAFQILNSWGTGWGDNGFFWAKYDDFARSVDQAYEINVDPLPQPIPEPEPKPQPQPTVIYNFAAQFEMKHSNGDVMNAALDSQCGMYCYLLKGKVHSGDRYRIHISNKEKAYVYVLSSDLTNNVTELFPHPVVEKNGEMVKVNFSPALTYSCNPIVIPDENHSIEIDNTKGRDYWCLLYSKEELDIERIIATVKSSKGSFYEKIKIALGEKMVPKDDIRFVENRIEFSAKSEKTVVPVIIEAKHK